MKEEKEDDAVESSKLYRKEGKGEGVLVGFEANCRYYYSSK